MTKKDRQAFLLPGLYAQRTMLKSDALACMNKDVNGIHCIVSSSQEIVSYIGPIDRSDNRMSSQSMMIRVPREVRFSHAPDTFGIQELLERTSITHSVMDYGNKESLILIPKDDKGLVRKLLQCAGIVLIEEEEDEEKKREDEDEEPSTTN